MPYLTPDTNPVSYQCRVLLFPSGLDWLALVEGAIQELSFKWNWEAYGSVTVQQTVDEFTKTFDWFCFNSGVCRVIGEIFAYAGQTSPNENWIPCDGRELSRQEYPDLYNVIGTTYGSSGPTTFLIPDLRGRALIGIGQGAGLSSYALGDKVGAEAIQLTADELAIHSHTDSGHYHSTGNSASALAVAPGELPVLTPNPIPTVTGTASANIGNTGGNEAHENRQPSIAINYLIVAR